MGFVLATPLYFWLRVNSDFWLVGGGGNLTTTDLVNLVATDVLPLQVFQKPMSCPDMFSILVS